MNKEPCKSFAKYKAKHVPRCNCYPCWEKFFDVNETKFRGARLAIKKYGEIVVERVHGVKYLKMLKLYIQEKHGNTENNGAAR